MEIKKTWWSRFGATQSMLTLWALDKKGLAIWLLISMFIPLLNVIVAIVAFFVCGANTRTWLYESTMSDEKKDGINEFITKAWRLIKIFVIIGVILGGLMVAVGGTALIRQMMNMDASMMNDLSPMNDFSSLEEMVNTMTGEVNTSPIQ